MTVAADLSFKLKKQSETSLSMHHKKSQLSPPLDDPPPGAVSVCLCDAMSLFETPTPRKKERGCVEHEELAMGYTIYSRNSSVKREARSDPYDNAKFLWQVDWANIFWV